MLLKDLDCLIIFVLFEKKRIFLNLVRVTLHLRWLRGVSI